MIVKDWLKQYFLSFQAFQAQLGLGLTQTFCDVYDAMAFDSAVYASLDELGIDFEQYAPLPGFNYQNISLPDWKILVLTQGKWNLILLPNPLKTFGVTSDRPSAMQDDSDLPASNTTLSNESVSP